MDDLNSSPSQFQIFKKTSAMRLQLDKPDRADQKFKIGSLYLQFAAAEGGDGTANGYKWKTDKISVKLGFNDIIEIAYKLSRDEPVNIYHTFQANDSKRVTFTPKDTGGFFAKVIAEKDGQKSEVNVAISPQEAEAFVFMIRMSLLLIHNWI